MSRRVYGLVWPETVSDKRVTQSCVCDGGAPAGVITNHSATPASSVRGSGVCGIAA